MADHGLGRDIFRWLLLLAGLLLGLRWDWGWGLMMLLLLGPDLCLSMGMSLLQPLQLSLHLLLRHLHLFPPLLLLLLLLQQLSRHLLHECLSLCVCLVLLILLLLLSMPPPSPRIHPSQPSVMMIRMRNGIPVQPPRSTRPMHESPALLSGTEGRCGRDCSCRRRCSSVPRSGGLSASVLVGVGVGVGVPGG